MASCAAGSSRIGRGVEQRVGVERLVLDEDRGTRIGQHPGVGPLMTGGMRVRHDDHRDAERGDLGEGR